MSEKATHYLISRGGYALLIAETHNTMEQDITLRKLLVSHGWNVTTSAAQPTERSEKGTAAGVIAGIRNYHNNRPLSICCDMEGWVSQNAYLTGRLMILQYIEILLLAGYLECGSLSSENNRKLIVNLD